MSSARRSALLDEAAETGLIDMRRMVLPLATKPDALSRTRNAKPNQGR